MLIENCMAIADRITIVICIIDFIIECIVTIDIFRNYDKEREGERERERERKGQSKKFKKEKKKKIHGSIETRSFVQRTKINVRCRENSKEVSPREKVG